MTLSRGDIPKNYVLDAGPPLVHERNEANS